MHCCRSFLGGRRRCNFSRGCQEMCKFKSHVCDALRLCVLEVWNAVYCIVSLYLSNLRVCYFAARIVGWSFVSLGLWTTHADRFCSS